MKLKDMDLFEKIGVGLVATIILPIIVGIFLVLLYCAFTSLFGLFTFLCFCLLLGCAFSSGNKKKSWGDY